MTNSKNITPGKETAKSQLQRTSSRRKAETDEDRGSPGFPVAGDACSPSGALDSAQYAGESLDFGDDAVDLI